MDTSKKKAIIIGAGPAGLTAAYELLKRTDIQPIIFEKSGDIGGISKTVNYKGNRMDIGGHRFFSKSDRVMNWWLNILPLQGNTEQPLSKQSRTLETAQCTSIRENTDNIMLVRRRLSRIYFLRKFFDYPISLSFGTLRKLGVGRTIAILVSYLQAQLFPRKQEKSLEDFMINRFGRKLYTLFFEHYTEKVWGVPCKEISAEWGAQRIKGWGIRKAMQHALQQLSTGNGKYQDIAQKNMETSLIEQFLYPKLGPGQLWEEVARLVEEMGGFIFMHHEVLRIHTNGNNISEITIKNKLTGEEICWQGDYFISTMPVKELIGGMTGNIPDDVKLIAAGLQYRDFITVGILLRRMSLLDSNTGEWKPLKLEDTWIYIQEKEVKVGRLQIFNNWSPYMVSDPDTVWVGMEFFCSETDAFWSLSDEEIADIAIGEFEKIGLASSANVLDKTVLRVEKTYPAHWGTYSRFSELQRFTDSLENLFLVGRNGMHKYNNADHSILTAMVTVDNIQQGIVTKENIWSINTEQEYHEEKRAKPEKEQVSWQPPASFKNFLFKWPPNLAYVWMACIFILLQFVVFKYLYPFAGFINGDSYVYLESAYFNLNVNTYPIGYSKFLRIFSTFTHSDTALVLFQYLLLQTGALYLFFTIRYFLNPGRIVTLFMFAFFILNPVFLYLSNYISSDALFLALSLFWFTSLLWIIFRPTGSRTFFQVVLLLLAFTVRYNAMIYPLISTLAFIIARTSFKNKLVGIAASFLVIAGFIYHTSNQYNKITGIRQFSPFSGWQLANNALYAYRYVRDKTHHKLPDQFRDLDSLVQSYFNNVQTKKNPWEQVQANTWYMWDPQSPLQQYMQNRFRGDSSASMLKRWATVAPLYANYGRYLIQEYPREFTTYFLAPNALKYYTPPVEFLSSYNAGENSVAPIAEVWFGYNTRTVRTAFKDMKVTVLDFFPIASGILNVLFILGIISFIMLEGIQKVPQLSKSLLVVAGLWLGNFLFSVFASSIALRFQLFPILVAFAFDLMLLEFIIKSAIDKESTVLHS